ncbi:MAG TPA: sulfotransferase [Fimbriimonas sp.]|nr:sulfotransferase [Fimbriimonas sp.]
MSKHSRPERGGRPGGGTDPTQTGRLLQGAAQALQGGRLEEAERLSESVLAVQPGNAQALFLNGLAAARLGKAELAVGRLKEVVRLDPKSFPAWNWLAMLLREQGALEDATKCCERAERLAPLNADVQFNLGHCYYLQERFQEAAERFRRATDLQPSVASYWYDLGAALKELGSDFDAISALRRGLRIASDPAVLVVLAELETTYGDLQEAIEHCQTALWADERNVAAHKTLSTALAAAGRGEEAAEHLGRAMELDPNQWPLYVSRGQQHQTVGRFAEAEADFRKALQIQPKQGRAYYALTSARRLANEDLSLIEAMQELVDDPEMSSEELPYLQFALGKGFDDIGDYEEAMRHFDKANALVRQTWMGGRALDRVRYKHETDQKIAFFTPEIVAQAGQIGFDSELPILIMGMMRTGTTLVEQILSSHPMVAAAGEQSFWTRREALLVDYQRRRLDVPAIERAAREYCEVLARYHPDSPHVTDKNPASLLVAGLIHLALPNARLLQMRRNPVDTALSIWMTPIRNTPPFVCDKGDIVFAYKQHLRLMDHWKQVLPAGRLLEIDYEELTADREGVTRQMVEFCGLPWDDACLQPEANQRAVNTPSFWQVRQPVYRTSVDRWKRYEPWLGPFRELLDSTV